MHNLKYILLLAVVPLTACKQNPGEEGDDALGTKYFTESDAIFANPERGFHELTYYTGLDHKVLEAAKVTNGRLGEYKLTLYRDCYYLTQFMESDIPQWYLERLDQNMQVLRENGAKCVLQFAYNSNNDDNAKPWDATPKWVSRHITQLTPYLQKNADVIFCMFAGFIGVWGEWYYTTGFPMAPKTDAEFLPRAEMLDQLLAALPADRQICLRTPMFKKQYLKVRGMEATPLTEAEAFLPTAKARLAGHNDCFIASANDWGTYDTQADRDFWMADTKYTVMGGESCHECSYSQGENAIAQMELYHWTHINRSYHPDVLNSWKESHHMDEVKRRLGYRLVLDKACITQNPKAGKTFEVNLTLRNVGFAAPVNPRLVELVFVSCDDNSVRYTYRIDNVDPRHWLPGEIINANLSCKLDSKMNGSYRLYLNLPDPYPSIHDNPAFSIRLANEGTWDAKTGYNLLDVISL